MTFMETTTTTDHKLDTCEFCGSPTQLVVDEFIDEPAALCLDCADGFTSIDLD